MQDIINEIERVYKLYKTKGASKNEINQAEEKLQRRFSDEYRNYLHEYGALSFGDIELTGLNIDSYANVVDVTSDEINRDDKFPKDCIVLEKIGVDNSFIIQDSTGKVYEWGNSTKGNSYKSLSEYLKTRI